MRGFAALFGAAVLALVGGSDAQGVDWAQRGELAALAGCTSGQPGTNAPQVDAGRTNMTRAEISVAAWTKPVSGRKVAMYLGKDRHSDATCVADSVGSTATCRYDYTLRGTWRSLRGCAWSNPDTVSRPGYEVRNNAVYLEWQDVFPGGNRQASRYAYPVSIALPTTVNVQTDIKILEESGIKNFNVTGISYDPSTNRTLLVDFQMCSRWPNNLTLSDNLVLLPGYPGTVSIASYNPPTCTKTDGSTAPFDTHDFCCQSGELAIYIGQQCDVGGQYGFPFRTDCFPGAAGTQDCTGKVLTANAVIGTPNAQGVPSLDLCTSLYNTVASVSAVMEADKPSKWILCAQEGETCGAPAGALARFGSDETGSWFEATVAGPFVCSAAGIGAGADPAPGKAKKCGYVNPSWKLFGTTVLYTVANVSTSGDPIVIGPALDLSYVDIETGAVFGSPYFDPPNVEMAGKIFLAPGYSQSLESKHYIAFSCDGWIKGEVLNLYMSNGMAVVRSIENWYEMSDPAVTNTTCAGVTAARAYEAFAARTGFGGDYTVVSMRVAVRTPAQALRRREYGASGAVARRASTDTESGYFFGDTVTLTTRFTSPDLPIYESRLTKLTLLRKQTLRTPNSGTNTAIPRNVNSTLVESAGGPSAPGALSQLAINCNFQYFPGSDLVIMKLTPNMMPADIGSDVSSVAFLSTDDFDSVSDYSFFASFRIYFDQQAASGQRRWRRLQTRDVAVPSSALRRSSSIGADASAGIRVPRKEEVQAEPAPSAPDAASSAGTAEALLAAAVAVGSTALAASCCAVAALVALRRGKERRRKEQEDASSLVPGWPGKAGYGRI